jgi:hypothetical protein
MQQLFRSQGATMSSASWFSAAMPTYFRHACPGCARERQIFVSAQAREFEYYCPRCRRWNRCRPQAFSETEKVPRYRIVADPVNTKK